MVHDLKNKVALVTGGANGIGAGIVRQLLAEGVKHVAILDVDETTGTDFQDELNSNYGSEATKFYRVDVTKDDELFAAYKSYVDERGGIDLVVNNAGIINDSPGVYKKEIELNVTALVTSTLKAIELMRKDEGGEGGTVINMSSLAALSLWSVMPIYWATKAAVLQFSNCIGQQDYYELTGVRVVALCPGGTSTAAVDKLGFMDNQTQRRTMLQNCQIQRVESVAQGVIDAYKYGESGSTWVASKDRPPVDITANVKKAYEMFVEHV